MEVGERSLASYYPRLFQIVSEKRASVKQYFDSASQTYCLNWSHSLRVGDRDLLARLQAQICHLQPREGAVDSICWEKSDGYTPTAQRPVMNSSTMAVQNAAVLTFTKLWKIKLPPRIIFFFWLLSRSRISSFSLAYKGVILWENTGCTYCSLEKNNLHIIMHCHFAWEVWSKLLHMCNTSSAMPNSLLHFLQFMGITFRYETSCLWRTIWFYCVWDLWKARNRRVFNDEIIEADFVVYMMISKAVKFYKLTNHGFAYSGNDVFRSLVFFCNHA
ncbi:uncharacterized protein LOC126657249 [Mercurialis annua]|uniref:uncharacterized protein LOC126657249 n=1 Tax=Mercurialis annua TaxID=3986 RepID=UPI002160034B|nr:uncharacterized protein LOC126657249 [Mercurialis annua]